MNCSSCSIWISWVDYLPPEAPFTRPPVRGVTTTPSTNAPRRPPTPGFAKHIPDLAGDQNICGTPDYIAPE